MNKVMMSLIVGLLIDNTAFGMKPSGKGTKHLESFKFFTYNNRAQKKLLQWGLTCKTYGYNVAPECLNYCMMITIVLPLQRNKITKREMLEQELLYRVNRT